MPTPGLCRSEAETIKHALLFCPFKTSKLFWGIGPQYSIIIITVGNCRRGEKHYGKPLNTP